MSPQCKEPYSQSSSQLSMQSSGGSGLRFIAQLNSGNNEGRIVMTGRIAGPGLERQGYAPEPYRADLAILVQLDVEMAGAVNRAPVAIVESPGFPREILLTLKERPLRGFPVKDRQAQSFRPARAELAAFAGIQLRAGRIRYRRAQGQVRHCRDCTEARASRAGKTAREDARSHYARWRDHGLLQALSGCHSPGGRASTAPGETREAPRIPPGSCCAWS